MEIFQALNDYALYTTPASGLEILLSGSKEGMEEGESFTGKKRKLCLSFFFVKPLNPTSLLRCKYFEGTNLVPLCPGQVTCPSVLLNSDVLFRGPHLEFVMLTECWATLTSMSP